MVNPKYNFHVNKVKTDSFGRVICIQVTNDHLSNFQVTSIYAPTQPSARSSFFENITQYVSATLPLVLAGDFNMVEDPWLDKLGSRNTYATTGIKELNNIKNDFILIDVWRQNNPYKKQFSWSTTDQTLQSRIDRIYVSHDLIPNNPHSTFINFPWSDHDIVTSIITVPDTPQPGPGTWKLNTSLLDDKNYVNIINQFLVQWREEKCCFDELPKWWDMGKLHIKSITREYASNKNRQSKLKVAQAQKELDEEQNKINPNPKIMQRARDILQSHEQEKNEGIFVRSKCQLYEEFEKPTKYFYNLINQNKVNTTIVELTNDKGKSTKIPQEIMGQTHTFYSNLFSKQPTDSKCQTELLLKLRKKLTAEESELLDRVFTKEELFRALMKLKLGKSPGIDGLPVEFYILFWPTIQDDFLEVVSTSYNNALLSKSMRTAILTLIFKKGDKKQLKNWRPISLLCADYKIIASALAQRLKQLLVNLTSPDQTCGVPKRSISSNLRLTRDIIKYTKDKNIEAVILNLDQEKAFDRVDHGFMDKVLNTMNIGPNFRKWVCILYKQIYCKISNNGKLSAPVAILRGVRQGCPLSALLYVLIAETLGEAIRQDSAIKGVRIPGKKGDVRVSQYADDTSLYLLDPASLKRALEIISIYERASGAKLNYDKTSAMIIGNMSKCKFDIDDFQLNWVNDTGIKILGITFFNDYFYTQNHNWTIQINKLITTLTTWSGRDLSLKGKALVINSLALSQIWYLGSIVEPSKKALKRINTAIFKFLWSTKMEQVKRDIIFLPITKGGLGILNPQRQIQALNLKFLQQIFSPNPEDNWVFLAQYWIGRRIGLHNQEWHFLSHDNNRPHAEHYPNFYHTFVKFIPSHIDFFSSDQLDTKLIYRYLQNIFYTRLNSLDNQLNFTMKGPKQWNEETLIRIPWKQAWQISYQGYNPYYIQDCLWKLRHHSHLTGFRLHTKFRRQKYNSKGKNCKVCSQPETALHLFAECRIAHRVWQHFLQYLEIILPRTTPFIQPHIMLGCFQRSDTPTSNLQYRLAVTLTSTIIYSLWSARNAHRFDDIYPCPIKIIQDISSKIAEVLQVNFQIAKREQSIDTFISRFAINDALCKVHQNRRLVIYI